MMHSFRAKTRINRFLISAIGTTWILMVAGGLFVLGAYGQRAGKSASSNDWPTTTKLLRQVDKPTLVLFLHPHCPCSHATLEELARALGHGHVCGPVYAVFAIPANLPEWGSTPLIDFAGQIPGVTVVLDRDGVECERFGARTSGQSLLFNTNGHLIFNGGLTPSRGHEGDTVGRDLVEQVLIGNKSVDTRIESPVFGCALFRTPTAPKADG